MSKPLLSSRRIARRIKIIENERYCSGGDETTVEFRARQSARKIQVKNSSGGDMRKVLFVVAVSAVSVATLLTAQEKAAPMKAHMKKTELSDTAYTAQALSAAPKAIAK